jgi:hypothetical protein
MNSTSFSGSTSGFKAEHKALLYCPQAVLSKYPLPIPHKGNMVDAEPDLNNRHGFEPALSFL